MKTIDAKVLALLDKYPWTLATTDGEEMNVIPVMFKTVTPDSRLAIAQVFMKKTIENIKSNNKVSLSVFDHETVEGYQIKGVCEYVTEGPIVEKFKQVVDEKIGATAREHGVTITANGVILVTPEVITVSTPGPENKKEL